MTITSWRAPAATLEWDVSPEPEVAGYKVYIGTQSRSYDRTVDVGPTNSYHLCAIEPGRTYYLAVTAYAADGLESDFSEEIAYTRLIDGSIVFFTPMAVTVPRSTGAPEITFSSPLTHEYFVQTSTNLLHWETAEVLGSVTNTTTTWRDTASGHPMRFYRVIAARR